MPPSSINDVPIELLLKVLKSLNSKEMVNALRVSRTWTNCLKKNQSAWRRVTLPEEFFESDLLTVPQLFNNNSKGTIEGFIAPDSIGGYAPIGNIGEIQRKSANFFSKSTILRT